MPCCDPHSSSQKRTSYGELHEALLTFARRHTLAFSWLPSLVLISRFMTSSLMHSRSCKLLPALVQTVCACRATALHLNQMKRILPVHKKQRHFAPMLCLCHCAHGFYRGDIATTVAWPHVAIDLMRTTEHTRSSKSTQSASCWLLEQGFIEACILHPDRNCHVLLLIGRYHRSLHIGPSCNCRLSGT